MTTGDGILLFGFLFLSLGTTSMAFWFKQPWMWFLSAMMWLLCAGQGFGLSSSTGDLMYIVGWVGIACVIVSALMVLQTRRQQIEEDEKEMEPWGAGGDEIDNYAVKSEEYSSRQKRLSDATGGRRGRRRRKA